VRPLLGYPVSGIALFDEPPRVSVKGIKELRNGLLLGMAVISRRVGEYADGELTGIVLVEDGSVTTLSLSTFVLDWRYSAETDQWIDVSMPKPDPTDIET